MTPLDEPALGSTSEGFASDQTNANACYQSSSVPQPAIGTQQMPDNVATSLTRAVVGSRGENVILDYDWTFSENQNIKNTVPYVKLYEKKLLGSSLISNLVYGILASADIVKTGGADWRAVVKYVSSKLSSDASVTNIEQTSTSGVAQFAKNVASGVKSGVNQLVNTVDSTVNSFSKTLSQALNSATNNPLVTLSHAPQASKYVDAYKCLYMTQDENFVYTLPYFTNMYHSLDNTFGERNSRNNDNKNPGQIINNLVTGAEDWASVTLELIEPGVYIEKSKFYNFENCEAPIPITFNLLNTKSVQSIAKNYAFINRLISKNKPFRQNRVIVDPPLIYEVKIPGTLYYPYAYIKSVIVNFVGNRRLLTVNGKDLIIPDAYEITIIVQSLTTQAANYMLAETEPAGSYTEAGKRSGSISDAIRILSSEVSVPISPSISGIDSSNINNNIVSTA